MPQFEKGKPRPAKAGRRKGTPNKSTVTFRETLDRLKFDVAEEAVKLFQSAETPTDIKLKLLNLLSEYSQTKPAPPKEVPPEDTDTRPLKDLPPEEIAKLVEHPAKFTVK